MKTFFAKTWWRPGMAVLVLLISFSATAQTTVTNWLPLAKLLKKWEPISFAEIQRQAEAGDAQAQHYLGYAYAEGLRVTADAATGAGWYRRALKAGYLPSANNLGVLYERGRLGSSDDAKAKEFYQFAAERGMAKAQVNLGLLYERAGDRSQAFRYFLQAAQAGDGEAMAQVYLCYWEAKGVAADHAKAMEWLNRSVAADNPFGECLMGYRCENTEWVGAGATWHQLPVDLPGALHWYQKSAAQNWAGGQYHLGLMYLEGKAVTPDEAHGLELIRAAADQDHEESLLELAKLYARGIGEPRRENETPLALLERLGKWEQLIFRHQYGLGTPRDLVMAARCCAKATADLADKVEFNGSNAGQGGAPIIQTPDDRHWMSGPPYHAALADDKVMRVLSVYLKAARGDGAAAFQLATFYETGVNAPQSAIPAWAWFSVAARNGHAPAREKIAALEKQFSTEELKSARKRLEKISADLKPVAAILRGNF